MRITSIQKGESDGFFTAWLSGGEELQIDIKVKELNDLKKLINILVAAINLKEPNESTSR